MNAVFSAPTLAAVMAGLLAGLLCPAIFASAAMRACNPPRRTPLPTTRARTHRIVTLATTFQARWVERRMEHTTISPGAVAEWCDALARSLRAGTTLRSALMSIEPTDPALAHRSQAVRQALGRGAIVSTAVIGLHPDPASRPQQQSPHLALAAAVLATSGSIGGPAAASLDRLAGALRLRVADGQERSAHSSQARLSAHVLTFVPLALLALLAVTDSDVRAVLSQPTGVALVSIGLALNLVGWWWMRCIVTARA
jgi:Flp pilus assembly protein TadB